MAAMLEGSAHFWNALQHKFQGVLLFSFCTSLIVWLLLRERRSRVVWSVLAFAVTLAFLVGAIYLNSILGLPTR